MLTIAFTFTGHTYHATPWESHVNEGLVEWPPSPWRILRACIAVGFSKLQWEAIPHEYLVLFETLALDHPWYKLPPVTPAHTRHFMPAPQKTTKIFDAFLRTIDDQPLVVVYPETTLNEQQTKLLVTILNNMTYLGRAESWVEARHAPQMAPETLDPYQWCGPSAEPPSPDFELVPLIAPWNPEHYSAWRTTKIDQAHAREIALVTRTKSKAPTPKAAAKLLTKVSAPYPETIIDCLLQDTGVLRKQGWSQPPGSERVNYLRPVNALDPMPLRTLPCIHHADTSLEIGLLALSPDTDRGTILPLMTRAVPQAELLHQALVSRMDDMRLDCPVLRGTDAEGNPLSGHQHVHFIPLSLHEKGRIDHFVVYAPHGFNQDARRVLQSIRRTWSKGITSDIIVTCVGFGSREQFARQLRTRTGTTLPVFGYSQQWRSVTPLILPRYVKTHGRHTPEAQICEHLTSAGFPEPAAIHCIEDKQAKVDQGFFDFIRYRNRKNHKPQPPSTRPWLVELEFSEPVQGPITAGYASHFGLGLFAACREEH